MNMKLATVLSTLLLLLSVKSALAQEDWSAKRSHSVDMLAKELFLSEDPGGTVLIASKNGVLFHKSYGKANLELDVDLDTSHLFRIASITKVMTAALVLQLEEEGRLSVNDQIIDHLDSIPLDFVDPSTTIGHLLSHTSGIRDYTEVIGSKQKQFYQPFELIGLVKADTLRFPVGSQFGYSNTNYALLGIIIEKYHDAPYGEVIEKHFRNLGISNAYYGNYEKIIRGRVTGYDPALGGIVNARYANNSRPYAAGGLVTNPMAIQQWIAKYFNGEILDLSGVEKSTEPFVLNNGENSEYGFGWEQRTYGTKQAIGHGGIISGFNSDMIYKPDEGLLIIAVSNSNANPVAGLTTAIFNYLETDEDSLDYQWPGSEPTGLKKWEGQFRVGQAIMSLKAYGNGVRFTTPGGENYLLYENGESLSSHVTDYVTRLKYDDQGEVIGLELSFTGGSIELEKVKE